MPEAPEITAYRAWAEGHYERWEEEAENAFMAGYATAEQTIASMTTVLGAERAGKQAAEAEVERLTNNARALMGALQDALSKQARNSAFLGGRHPLSPPPTEASGSE